jgi:hypothetical protein
MKEQLRIGKLELHMGCTELVDMVQLLVLVELEVVAILVHGMLALDLVQSK